MIKSSFTFENDHVEFKLIPSNKEDGAILIYAFKNRDIKDIKFHPSDGSVVIYLNKEKENFPKKELKKEIEDIYEDRIKS